MSSGAETEDAKARMLRIQAALRATASDGVDPLRTVTFTTPEEGMAALIAHVDRCVLPQTALIRFNDGQSVTIEAANRRFLRLHDPNPNILPAAAAALCARDAVPNGDVQAVRDGLIALCEGRTSYDLQLSPAAAADPSTSGGVPGTALRQVESDARVMQDRVAAFVETLDGAVRCALIWEGGAPVRTAGPESEANALWTWAAPVLETVLGERFPLAAAFETNGAYLFTNADSPLMSSFLACELGVVLITQIDGAAPDAILTAWRESAGTNQY